METNKKIFVCNTEKNFYHDKQKKKSRKHRKNKCQSNKDANLISRNHKYYDLENLSTDKKDSVNNIFSIKQNYKKDLFDKYSEFLDIKKFKISNNFDAKNSKKFLEKKNKCLEKIILSDKIENEKEKQKQPLDSRVVLNLIEVIKFIIQRKTFVILYESYINHAINQQYSIAFSYFVAICKQYPFKKLEEFYNYKTYNYAFRQLLRPFNRYNFKYFISRFQYKKKVEYMQILLTKMIKFKTLERIYLYGQCIQEDDEE